MTESKPICFKCGTDKKKLIKHHISYKPEIIVDCCCSCHRKIHAIVRKNNSCPYSVERTHQLSKNSLYNRSMEVLEFYEYLMPFIGLSERYQINKNTGNITISVKFHAFSKKKIWFEDI